MTIVLLLISILITIYLKGANFKIFNKVRINDKNRSLLYLTISSHVGTGNIVGVTYAIVLGGSGAIFWMWIFALFSTSFTFLETYLSQKYNAPSNKYISKILGWTPSVIYFLILQLSYVLIFIPIQSKTIVSSISSNVSVGAPVISLILGVIFFSIVIKGIQAIIKLNNKILPAMFLIYITSSLFIIIDHIVIVDDIFLNIVKEGMSLRAFSSGAIAIGIKRSLFSNEAGVGTTTYISYMNREEELYSQSYIQILALIVDTFVVCTISAVVLLIFNFPMLGIENMQSIYLNSYGEAGLFIFTVIIILFSFTTMIGTYTIGMNSIKQCGFPIIMFNFIIFISVVIGGVTELNTLWSIIDVFIIILASINILSLLKYSRINRFDIS